VDTQRFSMWKVPTILAVEVMSPTPTARPETDTTRNSTIKNWTSSCHAKLLYAPMSPPILNRNGRRTRGPLIGAFPGNYAKVAELAGRRSTPRGALERSGISGMPSPMRIFKP